MSGSIIANQGFMRQFGELNDLGEYKIDKWWGGSFVFAHLVCKADEQSRLGVLSS